MTDKINFLDLDAFDDTNGNEFIIKLKGVEHKLQPISVSAFIKNVKGTRDLPKRMTPDQEVAVIVDMIVLAFPTMSKDELYELSLSKLTKIMEFAKANNGSDVVTTEATSEGNAPAAA